MRTPNKVWSEFAHEGGRRILDLNIVDAVNGEVIAAVYDLRVQDILRGVVAQRIQRELPLLEYVNALTSEAGYMGLDMSAYH